MTIDKHSVHIPMRLKPLPIEYRVFCDSYIYFSQLLKVNIMHLMIKSQKQSGAKQASSKIVRVFG